MARSEEKKLMKQTVILAILSAIVGGIILFFILPRSINFLFKFIDSGQVEEDSSPPPQVPVIKAPDDATKEKLLTVTGFGEAGSEVVLVLNGEEVSRLDIGDDGGFSFEIELMDGENKIAAFSINDQDKESALSREYAVTLDTETPTIVIDSPKDGAVIELRENQLTTIQGVTEPQAKVYVNDRLTMAKSDGKFSIQYQLQEGENKIRIRAIDKAGNELMKEIIVQFRF